MFKEKNAQMGRKKTCMMIAAFGEKYQFYAPLHLYSIHKMCPDFHSLVFVSEKINPLAQQSLNFLRLQGCKFQIKRIDVPESRLLRKIQRWFLYDEMLLDFDYAYMGDVDILVMDKGKDIVTFHQNHMNLLETCFSNIIRPVKPHCHRNTVPNRMSGLHFVDCNKYFPALAEVREKYYSKALAGAYDRTSEIILHDMILDSGIKINRNIEYNKYGYRPHHGIHVALWRNNKKARKGFLQEEMEKKYKKYYETFKNEFQDDAGFQFLLQKSSLEIQNEIIRMTNDLETW